MSLNSTPSVFTDPAAGSSAIFPIDLSRPPAIIAERSDSSSSTDDSVVEIGGQALEETRENDLPKPSLSATRVVVLSMIVVGGVLYSLEAHHLPIVLGALVVGYAANHIRNNPRVLWHGTRATVGDAVQLGAKTTRAILPTSRTDLQRTTERVAFVGRAGRSALKGVGYLVGKASKGTSNLINGAAKVASLPFKAVSAVANRYPALTGLAATTALTAAAYFMW